MSIQDEYNNYLKEALFKYYNKDTFTKIYGFIPKQRDYTFSYCIDFLKERNNIKIAELGTSRSYVDGKYPGVLDINPKYWEPNNPKIWDWSAGIFTKYFSTILKDKGKNFQLTTIDISKEAIFISENINKELKEYIDFKTCSSEDYIRNQSSKSLDILYLDTGDMNEETAKLHLREAKLIVENQIIKDDGIILIDDVRNPAMILYNNETDTYGKSKYAIPYLLEHGYKIVVDEYQVILMKK